MISTRDLTLLPDANRLRDVFQSLAVLDAILIPYTEAHLRYFSFDPAESPAGVAIGSMANGSGDDLTAAFGPVGALICGFAHETIMSPYMQDPLGLYPGVVDQVPSDFATCLAVLPPHVWKEDVTFCIWRRHGDSAWQHGQIDFPDHRDPDGSEDLLRYYDGRPETYHAWAKQYYFRRPISLDAVRWVFDHRPLTDAVVRGVNAERSLDDVALEIRAGIGYPVADRRVEPSTSSVQSR